MSCGIKISIVVRFWPRSSVFFTAPVAITDGDVYCLASTFLVGVVMEGYKFDPSSILIGVDDFLGLGRSPLAFLS